MDDDERLGRYVLVTNMAYLHGDYLQVAARERKEREEAEYQRAAASRSRTPVTQATFEQLKTRLEHLGITGTYLRSYRQIGNLYLDDVTRLVELAERWPPAGKRGRIMIILKTVRDWTKSTWTWVISAPLGAAILFWFCALLQTALFGEVSSPTTRNGSWLPLAVVMTALWLLLWIPLGLSSSPGSSASVDIHQNSAGASRSSGRSQEGSKHPAPDTGHHGRDTCCGPGPWGRRGRLLHSGRAIGRRSQSQLDQPEEQEEEPPIPEYDPGPECDDIGGMSEYPPLPDDPA